MTQRRQVEVAILRDDVAALTARLAEAPALLSVRALAPRLYRTGMLHWIYVGDTWLHLAAAGHAPRASALLMQLGLDSNAVGRREGTPVHYAADGCVGAAWWDPGRQVATLRGLVRGGGSVHARDVNGATPLHRAVRTRCAAAAAFLFEMGADPEARNRAGSTPFHLAVQTTGRGGSGSEAAIEAQKEILRLFVARRVSLNLRGAKGVTVMNAATRSWVAEYLRELA